MHKRPLLIDLFCCQGGCSAGYVEAGFRVIGVDIKPQPRYPYEFIQGDVFEVWDDLPHDEAVAYSASPPCQAYSATKVLTTKEHPDLVGPVRQLLKSTNKPYIIENVKGAPLQGSPLLLCGTMFNLRTLRHRYFENNVGLWIPPYPCQHEGRATGCATRDENGKRIIATLDNHEYLTVSGHGFRTADGRIAIGADWMTQHGLSQAIPPAYTRYIGGKLMEYLEKQKPPLTAA